MNDPQTLDSILSSSQQANNATNLLSGLQQQLSWLLLVGGIVSIVLTILFIVHIVYKMRVERAILRIDKNLRKLVDMQVPAIEKVEASTPTPDTLPDSTDIEQK
jgi:uncharacterized membrane protein